MIYVKVEAVKTEEARGRVAKDGWYETDDIARAVDLALRGFHEMWDDVGHCALTAYTIAVVPK